MKLFESGTSYKELELLAKDYYEADQECKEFRIRIINLSEKDKEIVMLILNSLRKMDKEKYDALDRK